MRAQVGDADDNRGEHQRHQNHPQQIEKQVADQLGAVLHPGFERARGAGAQPEAAGDADETADEDLDVERGPGHQVILRIKDCAFYGGPALGWRPIQNPLPEGLISHAPEPIFRRRH
jgi:hypothetical protein